MTWDSAKPCKRCVPFAAALWWLLQPACSTIGPSEIVRFRPGLRCTIYHGPQRQHNYTADITLTTYAILRLDADSLVQQDWDTVILDEAQIIKNPDSQVSQAAYRLNAAFRITLSGTPVENRLEELWSQFHFLNRGFLGGRQHFQDRYVKAITGR